MDNIVLVVTIILGNRDPGRNRKHLGSFIKISEVMKTAKYTLYARICIYMNVVGALLEEVTVSYQDNEWSQTLDYEHIPFRCRKCHVHGHLFRDCPLNIKHNDNKPQEGTMQKDSPRSKGSVRWGEDLEIQRKGRR
jgi:hypothetical protein